MSEPSDRIRTSDRDFEVWSRYVNGQTQQEIAEEFCLHQSTVSRIVARMAHDIPAGERRARQRRQLDDLDHLRRVALDLVDAEPIPAHAGGDVITMPDGGLAEDHTGRIRALHAALRVQEREARALGLTPVRVSAEAVELAEEIGDLIAELTGSGHG